MKYYLFFFLIFCGLTSIHGALPAPSGLMCEMMEFPEKTLINNAAPSFSWIVNSKYNDDYQTGYQIIVSKDLKNIKEKLGELWDTKKVSNNNSLHIKYKGTPLVQSTTYYWAVKVWLKTGEETAWSSPQKFTTGSLTGQHFTEVYNLEKVEENPTKVILKEPGHYFVDFGDATFGTVRLTINGVSMKDTLEIRLGEKLGGKDSISIKPGASIRFKKTTLVLQPGVSVYNVIIPSEKKHNAPDALHLPTTIGEVMPFRYLEIKKCKYVLKPINIHRASIYYHFNNASSAFTSSDTVLNRVWELCKHTIKATSFMGEYIDGDRDRAPHEGDTYINQLSHYAVDREYTLARKTHEYLIKKPSSTTESLMTSILIAWDDYMYTGNSESLMAYYSELKMKTLYKLEREDGLIHTEMDSLPRQMRLALNIYDINDMVDWPATERDENEMLPINTAVNAFHYKSLLIMGYIAKVVAKYQDTSFFNGRAVKLKTVFNQKLYQPVKRGYVDGEGSQHISLHPNMLALDFDLVPMDRKAPVMNNVKLRGLACSVSGAQYLLEALYKENEADYGLSLMTSRTKRSWAHMYYDLGSTMTLEDWDGEFKPNLDWSHPKGTAPANIITQYLMGVRPLEPGFSKMMIKPQIGKLTFASATIPTIRGKVVINVQKSPTLYSLTMNIPANTFSKVYLPKGSVKLNGVDLEGVTEGSYTVFDNIGSGHKVFEVQLPVVGKPNASKPSPKSNR